MTARIVLRLAALLSAAGGFYGAGPTPASPTNPFGLLFLGVAVFVWIGWKPMMSRSRG